MIKKILYYSVRGKYPFVCIMRETDSGWEWWDIWDHWTSPCFAGKSKPRLQAGEAYILSKDFESVRPQIEQLMAEWKMRVLEDHYLEMSPGKYLENLFWKNKMRNVQFYLSDKGVITLVTTMIRHSDGDGWTQMLGIIGDDMTKRHWHRESDGELIINPDLPQITQEEARAKASGILDARISEYLRSIEEFCGANRSVFAFKLQFLWTV